MKDWRIVAVWAATCLCGCGTFYNNEIGSHGQADTFRFYGGVRKDLEGFQDLSKMSSQAAKVPGAELQLAGAIASFPLELTLSAVGDTILLPITVAGMIEKQLSAPNNGQHDTFSRSGASEGTD